MVNRLVSVGDDFKLPAAVMGPLNATYGGLNNENQWNKRSYFANQSTGQDLQFTGTAADFSGGVSDNGALGGTFSRVSISASFNGGTNGLRGDAVTSTAANGGGASYFDAAYIGLSGAGFTGKGSAQGISFIGALGAHATGAYGELGGITSGVTNDRPGGLAAASEMSLHSQVQAKNHVLGVIMSDNAGTTGLASYNWSRGLYVVSAGSQRAGDALYVSGSAGWNNFALFKNTTDAQVFRMDSTGKLFIGAGARTLYDDGAGNLKTDNVMIAPAFYTTGGVSSDGLSFYGDSTRKILWGSGVPAIAAGVGSIYLRTDGAAGATMYVKETGTGTTGWVAK